MRSLVVVELLSLDGVMQAPGDPQEDTDGGFAHGGWARPYFDAVAGESAAGGMAASDAFVFGRRTYESMAAYWPTAPADDPMAAHLNETAKYVCSTTLREVGWRHSALLPGDPAEAVAELKQQPGGTIVVLGSRTLVRALAAHDLVDRYDLTLHPLLLGSGKRLFPETEQPQPLRLVGSTVTTTGCLLVRYAPA